jgi:hypothetical protein
MSVAHDLYSKAFSVARDPRSQQYKAGLMAVLMYKAEGEPMDCPYPKGTALADAWLSGTAEGHVIWRIHTRNHTAGEVTP